MKKGKNERRITLGQKIIAAMLIMQSAVMAFLSGMVVAGITKNTMAEAIDNMETIVQERSRIVENYIEKSETILASYSRAGEILSVMKNPNSATTVRGRFPFPRRLQPHRHIQKNFRGILITLKGCMRVNGIRMCLYIQILPW